MKALPSAILPSATHMTVATFEFCLPLDPSGAFLTWVFQSLPKDSAGMLSHTEVYLNYCPFLYYRACFPNFSSTSHVGNHAKLCLEGGRAAAQAPGLCCCWAGGQDLSTYLRSDKPATPTAVLPGA